MSDAIAYVPEVTGRGLQRAIDQCAEDHRCGTCSVTVERIEFYGKRYSGDGGIGHIEFRYSHPGLRSFDGSFLIEPGRICGAIYGIIDDGSFSCYAD